MVDEAAIFWKKGDCWGRAKLAKYLDFVSAPAKPRIETTFEVAKMEDAQGGISKAARLSFWRFIHGDEDLVTY
jgi:hypothetical protein